MEKSTTIFAIIIIIIIFGILPKAGFQFIFLLVILIDCFFRTGKSYFS